MKWIDIVIYIVILIILFSIVKRELSDISCGDESGTTCDQGYMMSTFYGLPDSRDTNDQIKDKISFLIRYEENSIIWRRLLIASLLTSFISLYVVQRKVPRIVDFLVVAVICFTILYFMNTFYSRVGDQAVEYVDDNLKSLNCD